MGGRCNVPEVLVQRRSGSEAQTLETVCQAKGFRTKHVADIAATLEWLGMRAFEVLIVEPDIQVEQQQRMGDLLWAKNPLAQMVVCSLAEKAQVPHERSRLYGAEVVQGASALADLAAILDRLAQQAEPAKDPKFPVLIVEDLDSPREIMCAFLEGLGYPEIASSSSAKEALNMLQKDPTRFSCIITDIRMPEISGKQFIEQVRQHPKLCHLPVIALTAHGTVDCLFDCLKAGVTGFLVKPPKKKDLIRELSRARRVMAKTSNPRLALPQEADRMREALEYERW
jgi:CheY-like chemotaxis protein